MLGGRKAEAEVVVAVVGVVVVPIARRAVPGVVVPAAAPVHAVRVAGLTCRRTPSKVDAESPCSRIVCLCDGHDPMRTQKGIQRSFRRRIGLAWQNKCLELAHRSPRGLAAAELSLREPAHPRGTLSAAARPFRLYRFTSWEAARRKPRSPLPW